MVEWKKLGEVCEVLRGKRLTKSQLSETDDYPVLHGGSTPMGYYSEYNRKENTTVVVNTGNAGSVFFYDKKFWSSDACFSLYPNEKILDKFLYLYVYGCEHILKGKIRAGAMPTIDANAVESLSIPIPSLAEQERIVGILDTFTGSIENLKEQIAQRRKQYEHYRDQLLDLEGKPGVEMKTLGEVANLIRGRVISKDYIRDNEGVYPVYSSQTANDGILGFINTYMFNGDFLTWTTDGAYAGTIFRRKGKFNITNVCGLIDINNNKLNQGFLYYWLSFTAKNYVLEGMGNPKLMSNVASKIPIPLPSLAEQERIVEILDTFTESIDNLEAQQKEREKQYEYYRNKLLTFE